jgi:hypothetical protein
MSFAQVHHERELSRLDILAIREANGKKQLVSGFHMLQFARRAERALFARLRDSRIKQRELNPELPRWRG